MPQLTPFEPPPPPTEGDKYSPSDHYGALVVVKVKEHRERQTSKFSVEGKPALVVDLVDVGMEEVFRDVLWMGGAMVDQLAKYVGRLVVIRIEERKTQTGSAIYPAPVPADAGEMDRANKYFDTHGDPFAPTLDKFGDDKPPF